MTQALQGLRVLDLTHGPTGGIATMILADFGAEVIDVQRPEGQTDAFARSTRRTHVAPGQTNPQVGPEQRR